MGVVTKTEIMGCYFSELPIDTPLVEIMGAPVINCTPQETLQNALLIMQDRHIHRIYVVDPDSGKVSGTLSYPDIVGVLYRYCFCCNMSLHNRKQGNEGLLDHHLTVRDVMHRSVISASSGENLETLIELLAGYRIGALLLNGDDGLPVGVLSKTNLALAYRRGIPLSAKAESVMHRAVMCCMESAPLEQAIRQMIFAEVSRVFIKADDSEQITGIITLTDAARARSGSCRACSNSRIIPKG
jgi:predicted transcriptional regulator